MNTTSDRSIARLARSNAKCSIRSAKLFFFRSPAVSIATKLFPSISNRTSTASRVVPAISNQVAALHYTLENETAWPGVIRLEPGEIIEIVDGRCVIDRRPTGSLDTGTFARMQLIEERLRACPKQTSYRQALAEELAFLASSAIDEGPAAPDDVVLAWAERALELAPDGPSAADARRARAAVLERRL